MSRQSILHPVGEIDDFSIGKFKIFHIDGRSIGVVNTGEAFYAVLNVCPHALAPVCEGTVTSTPLPQPPAQEPVIGLRNRVLRCPWHGFEFDLGADGRAVFTDFRARVRLFPVKIEGTQVSVELKVRPEAAPADAEPHSALPLVEEAQQAK